MRQKTGRDERWAWKQYEAKEREKTGEYNKANKQKVSYIQRMRIHLSTKVIE